MEPKKEFQSRRVGTQTAAFKMRLRYNTSLERTYKSHVKKRETCRQPHHKIELLIII